MLTISKIQELQSKYKVKESGVTSNSAAIPLNEYLTKCKLYLRQNQAKDYNDMTGVKKNEYLINTIREFMEKHPVAVEGYVLEGMETDKVLLFSDLVKNITGESVIEDALNDESIEEIQINDKNTIFVIKDGVKQYMKDNKGRLLQFESNEDIITLINKLIDDGTGNTPQFSEGIPLLNAKTAKKQYRLNAVHHVANARGLFPNDYPITSVTLRKFKESHLEIDDLIKGESCTKQMGEFIKLLGAAQLKLFCIGGTGSGKTTLLRIIASTIPYNIRLILVQNPTEISFFERDSSGRNKRNVLHWEVLPGGDDSKSSATMPNLVSNTLRSTPDIILVGEARDPEEFEQIERVASTGHTVMGTFHADSALDAINRFAKEISNGDLKSAIHRVTSVIDVLIIQKKYKDDGSRKITEITEVLGVDKDFNPILRPIFKYIGREVTEEGKRIGDFVHMNSISDKLKEKFFDAGIPTSKYKQFILDNKDGDIVV